jgi:hypothetical protein
LLHRVSSISLREVNTARALVPTRVMYRYRYMIIDMDC